MERRLLDEPLEISESDWRRDLEDAVEVMGSAISTVAGGSGRWRRLTLGAPIVCFRSRRRLLVWRRLKRQRLLTRPQMTTLPIGRVETWK